MPSEHQLLFLRQTEGTFITLFTPGYQRGRGENLHYFKIFPAHSRRYPRKRLCRNSRKAVIPDESREAG